MKAEQVTDPVAYHGEGPVWWERWGGLRWVDMLAGDVLARRADGAITRRHVGTVAAALRPRQQGSAVIGVARGFARAAADGTLTNRPQLWSDAGVRMNEGLAIPTAASIAARWLTTSSPARVPCTGWIPVVRFTPC